MRAVAWPVLTVLALGALTACGSGDRAGPVGSSTPPRVTVTADPALAAALPDRARESGTLVVAIDPSTPPLEFEQDGAPAGLDIDLLDTVAAQFGVDVEYRSVPFDRIVPGVAEGRYDVGMSITVTAAREQRVHMVPYLSSGTQWVVQAGNPQDVDPDDPCGYDVAVQRGSVQFDDLAERNEMCGRSGQDPVTLLATRRLGDATTAVRAGSSDALVADVPVAHYAVQRYPDDLQTVGSPYDEAPLAIVVDRDQTRFAQALVTALDNTRVNGEYDRILSNWGNTKAAVDTFELDPRVRAGP